MSASQPRWHVIRSPAAPARRAGRAWDYGLTEVDELTEADLATLRADPGYTVIDVATPPGDTPDGLQAKTKTPSPRKPLRP